MHNNTTTTTNKHSIEGFKERTDLKTFLKMLFFCDFLLVGFLVKLMTAALALRLPGNVGTRDAYNRER